MDGGAGALLALLANDSRRDVIRALSYGPADVGTIQVSTGLSQDFVSHLLRSLRRHGLASAERVKTRRIYSLTDDVQVARLDGGKALRAVFCRGGRPALLFEIDPTDRALGINEAARVWLDGGSCGAGRS